MQDSCDEWGLIRICSGMTEEMSKCSPFFMTTCHEETPTGFLQTCTEQDLSWDEVEIYWVSQQDSTSLCLFLPEPYHLFLPVFEMWPSPGDLFCLIIQFAENFTFFSGMLSWVIRVIYLNSRLFFSWIKKTAYDSLNE